MHQKLRWNAIGIENKTVKLLETLNKLQLDIPEESTREQKKVQNFIVELKHVLNQITTIKSVVIPKLEGIFNLTFPTPEMIMLALSRPSIRPVFEHIEAFLNSKEKHILRHEEFSELSASGDAGNVLALIGDAVLDLAVVQALWDSSLATVGNLSKERTHLVSNQNLANVCDKWDLYVHRIHQLRQPTKNQSKPDTITHEKGTLVEAIYGVIYLEFGFDELVRIVPLIKYP